MTDPQGRAPDARGLVPTSREASLLRRLVARDEQALVELVDLATPWMLGVAQAMLRDQDEAEEVVMEAFRTAWRNVADAQADGRGLMPYLLRVVRHRAIDRLRARRRRQLKLVRVAAEEATRSVVPAVEPDEAGQPGWHVHRRVHDALERLPADQAAAVRLAYFEGLTQSEVAEALDIPLGTVKTRLRLAFVRLRAELSGLKDWVL
jgi:RNA polymerase sigma-70 factor (ECF subfamily)